MPAYWEELQRLVAAGESFVSVTLVDVIASAPQNVGAKMLVTAESLAYGTVGGGKIEAKAIAEARAMLDRNPSTAPSTPHTHKFIEWNLQRDVGMTCGGVVRLFFEAYNLTTWPIVIFGAGHCSQALVRLLLTMRCQITVIDPREEWLARLPEGENAEREMRNAENGSGGRLRKIHAQKGMAEYVKDLPANAFVLLMTMGHASDQPILIEILKTRKDAFAYVGVIGSAAKAATLRRGLLDAGLPEQLARPRGYEETGARSEGGYFCPLGLPIGTNDPAEIAVSVAAQLLSLRDRPGTPVLTQLWLLRTQAGAVTGRAVLDWPCPWQLLSVFAPLPQRQSRWVRASPDPHAQFLCRAGGHAPDGRIRPADYRAWNWT